MCRWPLRTGLDLGPLPGAVPCARAHVRQVLWEWGHAELGDDAGLVVSELVTNAVTASRDLLPHGLVPPVRLWLASDTELVLASSGIPARARRCTWTRAQMPTAAGGCAWSRP